MLASTSQKGPLCLVCEEQEATGRHYGCVSCFSCKTYFRRAVLQRQEPGCIGLKHCDAKKLCRGCRLAKCLEMGMNRAALQPKRDAIKLRKAKPIAEQRKSSASAASVSGSHRKSTEQSTRAHDAASVKKSEQLLRLITDLTRMDEEIRSKKLALIRSKNEARKLNDLLHRVPDSADEEVAPRHVAKMEEVDKENGVCGREITMRQDLAPVTQIEVHTMLDWVRTVPGFSKLQMEVQLSLLKRFAVHYLVLEYGYFTACAEVDDMWLITDGTYMPRSVDSLPGGTREAVSEQRKWRQEKLYKQSTDSCIDEVALPLRRLHLMPQEVLALKIIMLFNCGNHEHSGEIPSIVSEKSRRRIVVCRDRIVRALFEYYRSIGYPNYEERFGNIMLTLSGIYTAASVVLESYQLMRLFKFIVFDEISEQLLFDAPSYWQPMPTPNVL